MVAVNTEVQLADCRNIGLGNVKRFFFLGCPPPKRRLNLNPKFSGDFDFAIKHDLVI